MSSIYNKSYEETLLVLNSHNHYLEEMLKVEDKLWWNRTTQKNTQKAYEDYLLYSNGIYSIEAERKLDEFIAITKETEAWNASCQINTQKAYKNYLLDYKNAVFTLEAKKKIDELIDVERKKQLAIVTEKELWKTVCKENTQRGYESYLFKYLNGIYTFEAKTKVNEFTALIKEKVSWKTVCQENTKKAYESYLSDYPNTTHSSEAKIKIDEFTIIEKKKELERRRLAEVAQKEEEARLAEIVRKEEARVARKEEKERLIEVAQKEEEARLAEIVRKKANQEIIMLIFIWLIILIVIGVIYVYWDEISKVLESIMKFIFFGLFMLGIIVAILAWISDMFKKLFN